MAQGYPLQRRIDPKTYDDLRDLELQGFKLHDIIALVKLVVEKKPARIRLSRWWPMTELYQWLNTTLERSQD